MSLKIKEMSLKIKLPVVVKDRVVQTFTTLGDGNFVLIMKNQKPTSIRMRSWLFTMLDPTQNQYWVLSSCDIAVDFLIN